jgi:hypothetical protein
MFCEVLFRSGAFYTQVNTQDPLLIALDLELRKRKKMKLEAENTKDNARQERLLARP